MTTPALVAVTAASLVDALIVSRLLLHARPAPITLPRVLLAGAVLAFIVLGQAVVAVLVTVSFFLVVALAYAALMIVVPATGVVLILAARRRVVTLPVRILAWSSLVLIPIFVDATFIEPFRLVTERVDVPLAAERALPRPLVVGVLSDLQCVRVGDRERDAVARVMAAQPDLILLPGDLQQAGYDHRDEIGAQLRALFAPLHAPLGVWYVEGNTEDTAQARGLLAGTDVRVLDDEVVHVEHGGCACTLCGVDLGISSLAQGALFEIEKQPGEQDIRIVLAHRPDVALAMQPDSRVDLVVAGHTHGGQVQIPFFGPPITLSRVPRAVAAGGLHDLDGRRIYVSRGIGWEHGHAPRVRFLCPPEVTLLTLQHAQTTASR